MKLTGLLLTGACGGMLLLGAVSPAGAQNVLVNPGFESGVPGYGALGWFGFGNVFTEASNPPAIVPLGGSRVGKMFGPFAGGFGVSGLFQEFPSLPGDEWEMSSNARYWSGDPLLGAGAPNDNWVVQKIVFKDAADAEIGAVESVILDGTFAPDFWHAAPTISGTAPPGTVQVEGFILFLQPANAGGAALVDDLVLEKTKPVQTETSTWGRVKALYK